MVYLCSRPHPEGSRKDKGPMVPSNSNDIDITSAAGAERIPGSDKEGLLVGFKTAWIFNLLKRRTEVWKVETKVRR